MKTLSIVVPVYHNAESLPILFDRLIAVEHQLSTLGLQVELIFVDDGSGDASLEELLKIKQRRPNTKVIKLTRNFGANKALKCGFRFVTGDCFLLLAADLQDPPELIPELASRWLAGSRFTICERIGRDDPPVTRFLSATYYRLIRMLVMPEYPSGGYDIALMDKCFLGYMQDASKGSYTHLLGYWLGFKPEVIHYHRESRTHGKSRWTLRKKITTFLDVMLGFSVRPLRLMAAVGVLVATMSFVYGIVIVAYALAGDTPVPGFASIVALLAFLLGLVIVMLGMIGEYLARILDEINRRPEVVIDEVY